MIDPDSTDQGADPHAPVQPAPGEDSRVEDWFGQSVQRDADLAEDLVAEFGEAEAERRFEAQAIGAEEQDDRRGESIDPDQGVSAYRDDPADPDDETDRTSSTPA